MLLPGWLGHRVGAAPHHTKSRVSLGWQRQSARPFHWHPEAPGWREVYGVISALKTLSQRRLISVKLKLDSWACICFPWHISSQVFQSASKHVSQSLPFFLLSLFINATFYSFVFHLSLISDWHFQDTVIIFRWRKFWQRQKRWQAASEGSL